MAHRAGRHLCSAVHRRLQVADQVSIKFGVMVNIAGMS